MSDFEDIIFSYPARVLHTRQMDMTAMMDMLKNKHMMDPSMMDEATPFFWSAQISSTAIDSYYTHMLPSTLENFTAEAKAGVSFLNSHRHDELPFGRSIDARMTGADNAQTVIADFFTIPGLNLNGISTNDFITGVRSGIVKDVSVGLFGGKRWCDVCRMNYMSYDCPHVAGMEYDTPGQSKITATVGIDGAHLAEVSGVFDGSTPDANILKAQRMVEAGELKPDAVRMLEARYRMTFSNKRSFAGVSIPERKKIMDFEQLVNQVREVLALKPEDDIAGAVLAVSGERDRLRVENDKSAKELETLRAKVTELTPQAADGVAYRSDLIGETLGEGVRAMGDKFSQETYENVLRSAPLAVIKKIKEDWAAVGNSRFPGGRQTVDNSEAPTQQRKSEGVPAAAYKA